MELELYEALDRIAEIRRQMARTEVFRGYRALPVAFSGLLAVAAGCVQALWIPHATRQIPIYLALWIGAAVISATGAALAMVDRRRRSASAWSREITALALEQFAPSMIAGGLVTAVLVVTAPDAIWLLPGLWQVLFALGIFASSRLLPAPVRVVAAWYIITGIACLAMARGEWGLSPWAMALPFGVGQALAALILYMTLERNGAGEP